MKIIIDTDKKYVRVKKDGGEANYPTGDPSEILWIVADSVVPHPIGKK